MKRGLEWYKREPQAIRMAMMAGRVENGERVPMTTAQAAVYSLVIDLIYEGGGETPNEPQHIAAHFSDMGKAKARTVIAELVAMGKLFLVEGMLHEKRAEIQAKSRRKLSETCAESGRKGGVSSGISRRDRNQINSIPEAVASENAKLEREKEREEDDEDPREPLLDRVLTAAGMNPNDIPTAWWMPHLAERHIAGWKDVLRLTDDQIVRVVTENRRRFSGQPPDRPSAFDRDMRRFAEALASPPPIPLQPAPAPEGPDHARRLPTRSRSTEALEAFVSGAGRLR